MTSPSSRRDFFALEAGEYLERLARLAAVDTALDLESFVRFARALRGSALMAGPPGYAMVASAIEQVVKALRDGTARWSPALAESVRAAIATGQLLLRQLREWSEAEIARCERTAGELSALLAQPSRRAPADPAATTPTHSAAVRSYIARETAALAAALDSSATALEGEHDTSGQSLGAVSQRLRPLRGLGALPGLAPLPELLEALDVTLAQGGRPGAWPPATPRSLRAVSLALARLARDIAELGLPQPAAPELAAASEQLREAFADERDVVPIASLFLAGDPDPILRRGTLPARSPLPLPGGPPPNLTLELHGLAERLREACAQLRGRPPGAARALQLYSLALSLRGLSLSAPVADSAGQLLAGLDRAIMVGLPLGGAERLAELVERGARLLADAGESGGAELAALSERLAPLCQELEQLAPVSPEAELVVPIEALAPEPPSPSSLPPEAETAVVPIEALGYDSTPAYTAFEQTFSTYYRRQQEGVGVVPIESLMYRGKRALERADLVRRELDAALRNEQQLATLRGLLGELLDLVPLALDDER